MSACVFLLPAPHEHPLQSSLQSSGAAAAKASAALAFLLAALAVKRAADV